MTDQEVAKVAAEAGIDVRTVVRALEGHKPRSTATSVALHGALVKLGHKREAMRLERRAMHTPKRKAKP